jgi:hypothetical protein
MGYGLNPEVVEQRRSMLTELEAGRPQSWTCEPTPQETRRFAFRIREALRIAERYESRFPGLAAASRLFAIVEVADGLVEARFKGKTGTATIPDIPTHGLEPQGNPVPNLGLSTAEQVIQVWKDHLPSSDPIHFINTHLDVLEMTKLYNWSQVWKPRLMLLVDEQAKKLTVSLNDMSVKEFTWQPPKPKAKKPRELDL